MVFFELEPADISALSDGDLRELVGRLCEAELIRQGIGPSCATWGGAQEAPDGGLDVSVKKAEGISQTSFLPRANTGFQVKKHSLSRKGCNKEMLHKGAVKPAITELVAAKGAYVIVSGKLDCTETMLRERLAGMSEAVSALPNKDDLLLDFYGRDRLATWLRLHPSVSLWARSRLGKPLSGWKPFGRWAATPPDDEDKFLSDAHPCVIDTNSPNKEPMAVREGLELCLHQLRNPGSAIRLTGLSGVGKTRFAQALFEPKQGLATLPASDVIYADLGEDLTPSASELVSYLIANELETYVVLDNCPSGVHRTLQKELLANGAKLRLLTIEYDINDDRFEETNVIHLEPTSEQTISTLVQRRYPELGSTDCDKIAQFAGANARLALALASRVNADETLANFSDDDLFVRLFSQRKGESSDLLQSAEVLSLVYSFNVERDKSGNELKILADISGVPRKTLHHHHAELLRRQLAQQRGPWRAVLPHALAARLARRALQNIPAQDINDELFKPENLRLLQSCAHRLSDLHDCPAAFALALTWLAPNAPLGDISSCEEKYLPILDYIAPVLPLVVLGAIEQAANNPLFASRQNPYHARFVNLLCHLAFDEPLFDRALAMLLKFARTETPGENNNSIVGQMRQLFALELSGTQAPPAKRQALIATLLASQNTRDREIAKELLASAFEADHWTSFGTFQFGARKRGPGWRATTQAEHDAWFADHIKLLEPALSGADDKQRAWAKSLLAKHFRALWSFAGAWDTLEEIIRVHGSEGRWPQIWIAIKQTLYFDGEQLPPEVLVRLQALQALTVPNDPFAEVEAYVLADAWDHIELRGEDYEDKLRQIFDKVQGLGQLAGLHTEYLDRLGARLWHMRVQPVVWFGQGLAQSGTDHLKLLDWMIKSFMRHHSEQANILLLEGFISETHRADPALASRLIERALKSSVLQRFSVVLLSAIPIVPWVSSRLIALAQEGALDAALFEQVIYGRAQEGFSDSELATLLLAINNLPAGYLTSLRILAMRLHGQQPADYALGDELAAVGRQALVQLASAHRKELAQTQLHGIEKVVVQACGPTAPPVEVKNIIELLCEGIATYRLYSFELPKVLSALLTLHPKWFLDAAFDGKDREKILAHTLFRERMSRREPSLNAAPLDRLLAWCGSDQDRIIRLASTAATFSSIRPQQPLDDTPTEVVLSQHIKALLDAASDKVAVAKIICQQTMPNSWSGSRAEIMENRRLAFAELLHYPDLAVQAYANQAMPALIERISRERAYESAEDTEREQRFE